MEREEAWPAAGAEAGGESGPDGPVVGHRPGPGDNGGRFGAEREDGTVSRPETSAADDAVLRALDALGSSLEASAAEEQALGEQVRELRQERLRGLSWREALGAGGGAGVLTLLGRIVVRLTEAGAVLRRALADALASEGASTAEIAQRFGVSRQRIFRLLRGKDRP